MGEHFLCNTRNENISPRPPPPQLEAVKKKFSIVVKISCVIQETKIFHQGLPPSTGSCKKEILFRCENFLYYARNENISPRPPPPQLEAVKKKFSLDVKISCVMQETKIFQ